MTTARVTLAFLLTITALHAARADAPPAADGAAPEPAPTAPTDPRVEQEQRQVAEKKFERESIRFDFPDDGVVTGDAGRNRSWVSYRGAAKQVLEPRSFYEAVGRPDLLAQYEHRHAMLITSAVVGLAAIGGGVALLVVGASVKGGCRDAPPSDPCHSDGNQLRGNLLFWSGFGLIIASIIPTVMVVHYRRTQHPISEDEAKSLADEYNQGLRHKLGLPVDTRQPVVHDLRIVPYVGGHDGGLVIGARF